MTGFEPLIGAATAGLAGLIGNVIKEKGGDLLKKADIDLFQGRAFNPAVQKYVRRYADRHGILKVACVRMDNPVKLDEIYTAVQLLPRSALRYYESTESLQELFRESGKRGFSFEDAEKKQGIEVANEQQYLMVLGGPGVGKSTFLRKMGLEALRRQAIMNSARQNSDVLKPQETYYAHDCIPVMLELRQFSSKDLSIKDVIAQEFEVCGFPQVQTFTELFLKSGKLLVLLDGLDEVPSEALNHTITEIENLVDRYDGNRFIASCRVAAYTFGGFKRFNDVAMATFEDSQIERFIKNWFKKPRDLEVDTAKSCWELLSISDYEAAKELAQTPLLLTLLCVIYDEFQDFPKKRHQVYGEALDVLLRKWASEKRIQKEPIYQNFGADLELELLAEIAYTSFVDDQLFFSKKTVLDHIRDFQADNENAPDLDAGRILHEIEVQQGILVERSRDIYSFSHLTFQEYLTAKCVVDNQKSGYVINNHLTYKRWREIFLLVSGLTYGRNGANEILLLIEKSMISDLNDDLLCSLINWVDSEAGGNCNNADPVAQRIAAIALILILNHRLHNGRLNRTLRAANTCARSVSRLLEKTSTRIVEYISNFDQSLDLIFTHPRARSFTRSIDRAIDLAQEYKRVNVFQSTKVENLLQNLEDLKSQVSIKFKSIKDFSKFSPEFLELIRDSFSASIELESAFLSLNSRRISILYDYLYKIEIMIRCKEAAVRVSPKVWEGIESRILTVPDDAAQN